MTALRFIMGLIASLCCCASSLHAQEVAGYCPTQSCTYINSRNAPVPCDTQCSYPCDSNGQPYRKKYVQKALKQNVPQGLPFDTPVEETSWENDFEGDCQSQDQCDGSGEDSEEVCPYPFRLYSSYTVGRGLSYRRGYGTLGLFIMPSLCDEYAWKPFFDLRYHKMQVGPFAGNVGMGLRYLDHCNNRVYGINAYFDARERCKFSYYQLGIGFEVLTPCWDVRLNTYFPIGERTRLEKANRIDYLGGFFLVEQRRRSELPGVDFEIGSTLKIYQPCDLLDLYVAAGAYYYRGFCERNIFGGRARLALLFKKYLSLEVRATYDPVFKETLQGVMAITIPFGNPKLVRRCQNECPSVTTCDPCCLLRALASAPVYREEIIVLEDYCITLDSNFDCKKRRKSSSSQE